MVVSAEARAAIPIAGDVTCPTPAEIARRLDEIVPPASSGAGNGGSVRVARDGGRFRLELLRSDGRAADTREIDAGGSCGDLARAAAVVIATWQGDLDPDATPRVELPPAPVTAPRPAATAAIAASPAPARETMRPSLTLGVGLLASFTGGTVAPGAEVRSAFALGRSPLALAAALGATAARETDVGTLSDAARWTRAWLAVGPEVHSRGRTVLSARAEALGGLLLVSGVGLPRTDSDTTFLAGVGARVGAARPVGNARAWLDAGAHYWPGRQRLLVTGVTDQGRLANLEVLVAAGIDLGLIP
jgi:hypothetical protein